MKHVRQFRQETVKEEDPVIFDKKVNEVYARAQEGGKDPVVDFIAGLGLCASIRYFVNQDIPEDAKDEFELRGEKHFCSECPYFELPKDRRVKYVRCGKDHATTATLEACVIFYEILKEEQNENAF